MDASSQILAGIRAYGEALQAMLTAHSGIYGSSYSAREVKVEIKVKYARVHYAWIDLATGDCLKGTGKGPDRAVFHIKRGNVLDGSWLDWNGPYGIGYADSHGEFGKMVPASVRALAVEAIRDGLGEVAGKFLGDAVRAWVAEHLAAREVEATIAP